MFGDIMASKQWQNGQKGSESCELVSEFEKVFCVFNLKGTFVGFISRFLPPKEKRKGRERSSKNYHHGTQCNSTDASRYSLIG